MNFKQLITICFLLCSCSNLKPVKVSISKKSNLPKIPKKQIPGGNDFTWRYLGTTSDREVVEEINYKSIKAISAMSYQYADRKTIIDPDKFDYGIGQIKFKYVISNWQIDCSKKQYLILNANSYNIFANLLSSTDYSKNNQIKWMDIGDGSIANYQYNFICLNKDKNLGY